MDSELGSVLLALTCFSALCFIAAYLCHIQLKPLRHKLLAQSTAYRGDVQSWHKRIQHARNWSLGIGCTCLAAVVFCIVRLAVAE